MKLRFFALFLAFAACLLAQTATTPTTTTVVGTTPVTAGTTPTPAPIPAYSYTVSQALYATITATAKPALLPFQVVMFQAPTGSVGVAVTPQGTNVQASPTFTTLANLIQVNGWYQIEVRPSPVDPTQPMVLTAPLIGAISASSTATQIN